MRKGTITVNTHDMLPIIKKWLYSEHDIFLRELIANASDAITKRESLSRLSNLATPAGEIKIGISKKNKTIVVTDNGIGMTEDEVEKYIARLAFSGAEDFIKNIKEKGGDTKEDIIGKFGLGFYSTFMAADKVVLETLSMNEGAKAVEWSSTGDTEYTFSDSKKTDIGTAITLHLNHEFEEFLDYYTTRTALVRHCGFMPYHVVLEDLDAKKKEEKADTINETTPLWKKNPKDLTDKDYKEFYTKLFPVEPEPLFWMHLNIDHPFHLQGILYFPKFNPHRPLNETNIKLFCRQVFVSDNVKKIVPDFLTLLKGAIDSTDIPLNVSRSTLQGDPNIRKISNYIIKKVAESLKKLFSTDRKRYEEIWSDMAPFVKYGCMSDTKFDELMRSMVIFKNSEGKFLTLDEYTASVPATLAEKLKNKIVYFEKDRSDVALLKQLKGDGVEAIETDAFIDPHFMQYVEMNKTGENATTFVSIEAEAENLLTGGDITDGDIKIREFFKETLVSKDNEAKLDVEVKRLKSSDTPAYVKIDEHMKRFAQMMKTMPGEHKDFPIKKILVVNPANSLVQSMLKIWELPEKKELAQKLCRYVQDLAVISSEGLRNEEKDEFVKRSQNLISDLVQ
jgi:molecular chaperone HtpG